MVSVAFDGTLKARLLAAAAVGAAVLGASSGAVNATTLYWSGNGATQGGASATTWNTTNQHWGPNGGPFTSGWVNANADSAVFDTTAGVVQLNNGAGSGSALTVNTITTSIAGYSIGNGNVSGGGNTIIYSGPNAGFNTAAVGLTTLSAIINGTFTKSGPGRLELENANNSNSVRFVLTGGTLSTASIARLSATGPGSLAQNYITFDGGGWAINTASQNTGTARGITIKSGGAFFGSASTSITLTISAPIVGTEGGGLTLTNAGPFTGNPDAAAGGVVALNNASNSWDGPTTIANSSSTLRLGIANVIPNGSAVTLTAGALDSNNVAETIGSLAGAGSVTNLGALTTGANNASTTFSGTLSGNGRLIKVGAGTMTLSGANPSTYSGPTLINEGTLSLSKSVGVNAVGGDVLLGDGAGNDVLRLVNSNQISDTAALTLNGGLFNVDGESETLGVLALTASSIIDLGAGNSILKFNDSSVQPWDPGTLSIYNWTGNALLGGGTDQLFVGDGAGIGLTESQLAAINFYSDAGITLLGSGAQFAESNTGEILPVPEPTALALLGLGAIGFGVRRRHA